MDGDKFISKNKNTYLSSVYSKKESNFFKIQDSYAIQSNLQAEPTRHLNDYDSNILQQDAYKGVSDDIFKLEYKIAKLEDDLKEINKQIQMAEEIYDYYQSDKLLSRKQQLINDLAEYNELYKEASLSAKISSDFSSKIKDKFLSIEKVIGDFIVYILSKLPGKLSSVFEIKNSLNKLESINKSVDELINSSYPYGEAAERYERLSKYIVKANSIQSELSKFMK